MSLVGTVVRGINGGPTATFDYGGNYMPNAKYRSGGSRLASDDHLVSGTLILRGVSGDVAAGVSSPIWIQFFDAISLPGDGAVADYSIGPIYGAAFFSSFDVQRPMKNGLCWCVSSTNPTKTLAGAVAVLQASWRE